MTHSLVLKLKANDSACHHLTKELSTIVSSCSQSGKFLSHLVHDQHLIHWMAFWKNRTCIEK